MTLPEAVPARFRKKPVVIEAMRFDGKTATTIQIIEWVGLPGAHLSHEGIIIPTLEGDHLARQGDWVIRGVNGEFYLCKPDIFTKTYDPVATTDRTVKTVPGAARTMRV